MMMMMEMVNFTIDIKITKKIKMIMIFVLMMTTTMIMAMTEMMDPKQRGRSLESCLSEISAATDKIMKPCLLINAF